MRKAYSGACLCNAGWSSEYIHASVRERVYAGERVMRASVSVSTTFDHDHKHEDEHGQRGCTYLDVPVVRFTGGGGEGGRSC